MPTLRVLAIHGVGDHHTNLAWRDAWLQAMKLAVGRWDPAMNVECDFPLYDDIFEEKRFRPNPATYAAALAKLTGSAIAVGVGDIIHGVGDAIGGLFRPSRGLADIPNEIRWTAGMVAQWGDYSDLRKLCRERIGNALAANSYDVVLAHSLGTLVSYDTFTHDQALPGANAIFGVFGSQIANPFVRGCFGGFLKPLEGLREWFQLYNPNDRVLTGPITIPEDEKFQRVETTFTEGFASHDAVRYLLHENAVGSLWQEAVARKAPSKAFGPIKAALDAFRQTMTPAARDRDPKSRPLRGKFVPNRRALLVGINEYPNPQNRLEGCINDCFLISAALQQRGFDPDDIRVVFDDRATSEGVMDRLHWLLDGTRDNDERVLFYSGHGAQIPGYGADFEVDHLNECLVTYDFDWTEQHAITDKQFVNLYSQLPFKAHFVTIFDCCHSGGMTREGGARVRGITPPDDIRHRALKWDIDTQMWVERKLKQVTPDRSARKRMFGGKSGNKVRLGRGVAVRVLGDAAKKRQRAAINSSGPYMPTIIEACQEQELSYEYRHGVTSYGAFTFSLIKELQDAGRGVTFSELIGKTKTRLHRLKYAQTPCLTQPGDRKSQPISWRR